MPFLKNVWYVAANASELDQGLVSRTICNEQIVMFRTESGSVAALQDRCPHRFVPLSMGRRVGAPVVDHDGGIGGRAHRTERHGVRELVDVAAVVPDVSREAGDRAAE